MVLITGERFDVDPIVRFGGEPAASVVRIDSRTLQAVTPPGLGMVAVSVENPNHHVGTLEDGFEFKGLVTCRVATTSPAPGSADVPIVGDLRVEWSEPIDPATAVADVGLRRLGGDGATIDGEVTMDGDRAVIVRPSRSLRFWDAYTILVGGGVLSESGEDCEGIASSFATIEPAVAPRALRPAAGTSLDLTGSYAVVASDSYRGLQVWDLSDPAAGPALAAELPTEQSPSRIAIHGDRAYVAATWDGVLIVDLADPTSPAILGRAGTPGVAQGVAVFERGGDVVLAVADGREGVRFIEVTDPAAPHDLGALDPSGARDADVRAVAIDGDLLAIADGRRGFAIASLPDPADSAPPEILAQGQVGGRDATGVAWNGSTLYVARGAYGIVVFDATDPFAPLQRQEVAGPDGVCGNDCDDFFAAIAVSENELYASIGRNGVARYAIDGSGDLTMIEPLDVAGSAVAVRVDAGGVYAVGEEGLLGWDRASGAPMPHTFDGHGIARAVAVWADAETAWAAVNFGGVQTFDVSTPSDPLLVDRDDTQGSVYGDVATVDLLGPVGDLLFAADGRLGVTIFDVSDPRDPTELASIDTRDDTSALWLDGSILYGCEGNEGAVILDVSDPSAPVILSRVAHADLPGGGSKTCQDLIARGDLLYVAGLPGLTRVDVGDPAAPAWLEPFVLPTGDLFSSVAQIGDYLVATTVRADFEARNGVDHRLRVFELEDDGMPRELWSSDELGGGARVTVTGDVAFVAARDIGVYVFDLADPTAPVIEGVIETRGNVFSTSRGDGVLYGASLAGGVEAVVTGPLP